MADDDGVVITGGNASAEALAVFRLKVLFGGHQNVGSRVKLEILGGPLLGQVIGDGDQRLIAQSQPLALLSCGHNFEGFACAHNVCQQRIAAVQNMGNGIDLMGPQGDFRINAYKIQMAAVVFTGPNRVEGFIIEFTQPFPTLRVFPYPVGKCLLDELLLGLGNGGFLFIQHCLFMTFHIFHIVENPHIFQIQRFLNDMVAADPFRAIGAVGLYAASVKTLALDIPGAGMPGVMHFDVRLGVVGGAEQFKHKPGHIPGGEPGSAQPHGNLAGGQIHRLHGFQRLCVDTEPAVGLCGLLCLPQLLPHIAGKVFVCRHIDGMAFRIFHAGKLEYHPVQFFYQGRFVFSGQAGHVGDIDSSFFCQGKGQGFRCGIHTGNIEFLLDGAFGEHIRLADEVTIAVCNLQRRQQEIGAVIMECRIIGPLEDAAIFFYKGVIEIAQFLLLGGDEVLRVILRLVLNELPHTIPQANETFDAAQGCGGNVHRLHDAVFPVVNLSVHDGVREITNRGVSRNCVIFLQFVSALTLILLDGTANVADGGSQQVGEFLPLKGDAGRLRPIRAADLLHFAQNHFRVVDEIPVHLNAAFTDAKMHPVRLNINQRIPLLQEQNVGSDFRTGSALERVVGQTDGSQQIGPLGDVFAYCRVFFVHGAFAGDKGHNTAGAHLVQSFAKEVVVDQEIVLVVAPVGHLEIAEGDIADGHVKETVGQIGFLIAADGDRGGLVQLLGDSSADFIQFNAVAFGAGHTLRDHAQEVAGAAGRLQDVAGFKAHLLQRLIHGTDNNRRRIKGGQCGFPCRLVFLRRQQAFQLQIIAVGFLKAVCQTAPAHIPGKNLLFLRRSQPVLTLQLFQQPDSGDVVLIPLAGSADAEGVICDMVIMTFGLLRVKDIGECGCGGAFRLYRRLRVSDFGFRLLSELFYIPPLNRFFFGNRLFHFLQVVICLPLTAKFFADTCLVNINLIPNIIPDSIAALGFDHTEPLVGFLLPGNRFGISHDLCSKRMIFRFAQRLFRLNFVVFGLFFSCEITALLNQASDPFGNLLPCKMHIRAAVFFVVQTFSVVTFPTATSAGQGIGPPTNTVFLFKKICCFFFGMVFLEKSKDAAFASGHTASAADGSVNFVIGNKLLERRNFCHCRRKRGTGQGKIMQIF